MSIVKKITQKIRRNLRKKSAADYREKIESVVEAARIEAESQRRYKQKLKERRTRAKFKGATAKSEAEKKFYKEYDEMLDDHAKGSRERKKIVQKELSSVVKNAKRKGFMKKGQQSKEKPSVRKKRAAKSREIDFKNREKATKAINNTLTGMGVVGGSLAADIALRGFYLGDAKEKVKEKKRRKERIKTWKKTDNMIDRAIRTKRRLKRPV